MMHYLVKNLLVCSAFLFISSESTLILENNTRLGSAESGFIQPYFTWNTGGVVQGNSDTQNNHFLHDDHSIPNELWIIMVVVIFIFVLLCINCIVVCQIQSRRLRRASRANRFRAVLETSPPGNIEVARTSVGTVLNDVPPDYIEVTEQKTMAANDSSRPNRYPKVVGGKKLETPPPDYMTVAPFKSK